MKKNEYAIRKMENKFRDSLEGNPLDEIFPQRRIAELRESHNEWRNKAQELHESLERQDKVIDGLREQNKFYRQALKETNLIIFEAIESLNKGEKINGLGFLYMTINQVLEGDK